MNPITETDVVPLANGKGFCCFVREPGPFSEPRAACQSIHRTHATAWRCAQKAARACDAARRAP